MIRSPSRNISVICIWAETTRRSQPTVLLLDDSRQRVTLPVRMDDRQVEAFWAFEIARKSHDRNLTPSFWSHWTSKSTHAEQEFYPQNLLETKFHFQLMSNLFFFLSSGEKYNFSNAPFFKKIQIMVLQNSVISGIFKCNDEDNFKIVTI